MKLKHVWSESWRNLVTGTSRALIGLICLAVLTTTSMFLHGSQAKKIFDDQTAFVQSGAATVVVTQTGNIDAKRCAALGHLQGVQGSVALRSVPERFKLDTLPNTTPALHEYNGQPLKLFGGTGTDVGNGVLLSSLLANQIYAEVNDEVSVAAQKTKITGIFRYPDDGRDTSLSSTALTPVPAEGTFNQCLYTVWPSNHLLESLAQTVIISANTEDQPEFGVLNSSLGPSKSTEKLLHSRDSIYFIYGAAIFAGVLGFLLLRSRKIEFSVAQHLGQSRLNQLVQIVIESALWIIPGSVAGIVITLISVNKNVTTEETTFLITETLIHGPAIALCALFGVLVAAGTFSAMKMQAWSKDR
ncbi:hypothetical protein [Timonella sp. A28]|uniref:hypothetical protein n=1 Tax=Timonella sp. A28 TaxID=3442640 RepID=UPI003EB75CF2